jgi:LmbE family N-acetylglucosaminyl deacetylase
MADLIVLSPHLDDAVLSLGGTIARAVDEGRDVEVVTFFTDAPPPEQVPEKLRVFADYEARRAEDAAALEVLDASPRWLGLVERAFREPFLSGFAQVFGTPDDATGFPNLEPMQAIVEGLLREHPDAQLRAPLGVGHHFDHVEVFVAAARALAATEAWDRVSFYEDPYALGRRMRRRHFVTRERVWPWWGGPDTVSLRFRGMVGFMAFASKGPGVERYLPDSMAAPGSWRVEPQSIESEHAARKIEAISRYPSQVEALGGLPDWERAIARYHAFWGGAEPRWFIAPESGAA